MVTVTSGYKGMIYIKSLANLWVRWLGSKVCTKPVHPTSFLQLVLHQEILHCYAPGIFYTCSLCSC